MGDTKDIAQPVHLNQVITFGHCLVHIHYIINIGLKNPDLINVFIVYRLKVLLIGENIPVNMMKNQLNQYLPALFGAIKNAVLSHHNF